MEGLHYGCRVLRGVVIRIMIIISLLVRIKVHIITPAVDIRGISSGCVILLLRFCAIASAVSS